MRPTILLACLALSAAAQTNPYTSASDAELGGKLYRGRCGHCHGQAGEGGRGAVLTGTLRHGSSDAELFQVIRRGIPGTEMPGAFNLPEMEIWRMVTHLKQLRQGQGGSEVATGNAAAGAKVYESNGCARCHSIRGHGGYLGPDLTDVGAKRALRHLRESVVNPNADLPLDYRTVIVVTPQGSTVSGIHLNEDETSVHLRDLNGNIRSFLKREVKGVRIPRQSLMPAYTALSPADLDNLVAYMSSLRPPRASTWRFDRLENIGGHKTTVLGSPRIIDSPAGKAVEFDGVDDALFIDTHPLAGAETFTFEAIFRPDGGQVEQRWFHLSETDPNTGADTDNRMLFEIRVAGDQWFLDSYNQSGTESKALMNRKALHPLGRWYHVASVYDGSEFRNYVDGVQEGSAMIRLAPHGPGHTSVGVRINKVFYFKGAVAVARFTPRALPVSEFLKAPAKQ
jgi:putative heme-binding domain-containing protein